MKKSKSRNLITIDLSGCKNMKECGKIIDSISSGRVKISVKKLKLKTNGTIL
jgi:hypothetical protein